VAGYRPELAALTPPPELAHAHGGEDFGKIGAKWAETLREVGGLEPTDHVLDVGCGPGRMAIGIASYLRPAGRYEGFDISRDDIAWCKQEIEPRWPGARFQHLDVRNGYYNPAGTISPEDFSFPFGDASFDFVYLTSVFTHMRPAAVNRYLSEVARVLRPNGRSLITWFLLNRQARAGIAEGTSLFTFQVEVEPGFWADRTETLEKAVAYEESTARRAYEHAALSIREPIVQGSWSGAVTSRHAQDIVVATKPG
jgi:ubiquinone/menaquinone biosynthesis C-methylase UbiE